MRRPVRPLRAVACALALALAWTATTAGGPPAPADDGTILHVLHRVTYGPRPGDVERVRALGIDAFIERQLAPERLDDRAAAEALRGLTTLDRSIAELRREYPRPDPTARQKLEGGEMSREEFRELYPPERRPGRILAELSAAKAVRAVRSERQLEEVMVDFWFNHFNVSARKGLTLWFVTAYERDAIRPHALGKFPDLVRATARHPAMLFYLDNWLSVRPGFTIPVGPNPGAPGGLNENYARELMELHTLGVDGGYTQADVREVARAFTGWTIDRARSAGRFVFRPFAHDRDPKVVLGRVIPAGGGQEDGEHVIDVLVRHPSTARFIATKLCRRFVQDDPPAALVERVAATYLRTGGDVRAMLRTIFTAPEFYAEEARGAKVKKPFELVVSAVRALGGEIDARGGFALARAAGAIGETLYQAEPPTGYPDRAEAWVSPGALLARMNFAMDLTEGRLPGVRVSPAALGRGDALVLGAPEFQRR